MRFEKHAPGSYPAEGRWSFAGRREALRAVIWVLGVAGFLGPLLLARTSPHPDRLRVLALGWFIAFGLVNAGLVIWERRGRGPTPGSPG